MQKIILTVGPSLGTKIPLYTIHKDFFIYRINGAHGSVEDIKQMVLSLKQQQKDIEILIDLPGNKIRTANIQTPIAIKKGEEFSLKAQQFNYPDFIKLVKPGMKIYANDSCFLFIVKEVTDDTIIFLSQSDGVLLNGKGMHVRNLHYGIPFLFERDRSLIELCDTLDIAYVGASFVRRPEDILELKSLLNPKTKIIAKVETLEAVNQLYGILQEVGFILIDRGDLSTEIGIEKIPRFQKFIIEKAHHNGVKVFLATQILKNMEKNPVPTIAEIDDLYSILKRGIFGVQLSEETAVGLYIKECIEVLLMMHKEINAEQIIQ